MSSLSESEGFLKMVNFANNFLRSQDSSRASCLPFMVGDKQVGLIRPDFWKELKRYSDAFQDVDGKVTLSPYLKTFEERSKRLAEVMEEIRQKDIFVSLQGWRDECYSVCSAISDPPLFKLERSAACIIGSKQLGVHINGYVNHSTRGLCMWVARRSKTKQTWPGKLDQMAAGGLEHGLGIRECAEKESAEEASVPKHVLKNLKAVGSISYVYEDERGVFPETQYVFDLKVPEDFTPVNADGEVQSFELRSIDEVRKLIITEDFKFNCALVILDFLIRHSLVDPDSEPQYSYLVESMHKNVF